MTRIKMQFFISKKVQFKSFNKDITNIQLLKHYNKIKHLEFIHLSMEFVANTKQEVKAIQLYFR